MAGLSCNDHTLAFACLHVLGEGAPVLLVRRDDGDWGYYCGEEHEMVTSNFAIVGVGHLLDADPSLRAILDLDIDETAERFSARGPWIRAPL